MSRTELEQFLATTFQYRNFEDTCQNGLQVEGKAAIQKIACGVSFNLPFLEAALQLQADALLVHHGIFGKNVFSVTGTLKAKIKLLLQHDMSLFGIHLPLDAHREYGNNAQLFAYLGGEILEPYEVGYIGQNSRRYPLAQLLEIFHHKLHPAAFQDLSPHAAGASVLTPKRQQGFLYFDYGPAVPEKIAIVSGGAAKYYAEAVKKGVDTFICGSVDEPTPAIAYETNTNFINLGHYWSEKPGILALQAAIEKQFGVETAFLEIANVI